MSARRSPGVPLPSLPIPRVVRHSRRTCCRLTVSQQPLCRGSVGTPTIGDILVTQVNGEIDMSTVGALHAEATARLDGRPVALRPRPGFSCGTGGPAPRGINRARSGSPGSPVSAQNDGRIPSWVVRPGFGAVC